MKFSNSPYVYLSISVTLCFLALGFIPEFNKSAASGAIPPPPPPAPAMAPVTKAITPAYDIPGEDIHTVVDQMPLWPGSEDEGDYASRKRKSDQLMLDYIYANIKYPEEAKDGGVEGMAVVSFIVEKDGRVSNVIVARDPGAGTGAEVVRVVRGIANDDIYWHPGRLNGKPVRTHFNLPVKFKLK